ncbi:MAG: DUF2341 domain-containing protein [Nanoarchaeota archaeon]|nr:DUF2341 domain-containing protein [Nanoarchaeota archaeon]MBU1028260.1 DUF2341 domain-containing protein [Nanoarchaeota archaeon]
MGRTRLAKATAVELQKRIAFAQKKKKELISYFQNLNQKYTQRQIPYSRYIEILHKKTDNKTLKQWIDFYSNYTKECEELLKKQKKEILKRRIPVLFFSAIFIIILITSMFYIQPIIVGFFTEQQEFTQDFNIEFNGSTTYEWQIENPGTLDFVKLSGFFENKGQIKIYLDDLLILNSKNLKENKKTSAGITGQAIANTENIGFFKKLLGLFGIIGKAVEDIPDSSPSNSEDTSEEGVSQQEDSSPSEENSPSSSEEESSSEEINSEEVSQQEDSSPSEEEPLTSETEEKLTESKTNITIPEENITGGIETNIKEEPEPEINVTKPETNITIPEENILEEGEETNMNITKEEKSKTINFKDICEETCNISNLNLNKTSYTLKIEIKNSKINIDNIKYKILKEISEPVENITLPEENITTNITEINITIPTNTTISNFTKLNFTLIKRNQLNIKGLKSDLILSKKQNIESTKISLPKYGFVNNLKICEEIDPENNLSCLSWKKLDILFKNNGTDITFNTNEIGMIGAFDDELRSSVKMFKEIYEEENLKENPELRGQDTLVFEKNKDEGIQIQSASPINYFQNNNYYHIPDLPLPGEITIDSEPNDSLQLYIELPEWAEIILSQDKQEAKVVDEKGNEIWFFEKPYLFSKDKRPYNEISLTNIELTEEEMLQLYPNGIINGKPEDDSGLTRENICKDCIIESLIKRSDFRVIDNKLFVEIPKGLEYPQVLVDDSDTGSANNKDSYIRKRLADNYKSYGQCSEMLAGKIIDTSYDYRPILEWTLSSGSGTITSIDYNMYRYAVNTYSGGSSATTRYYELHELVQSFTEGAESCGGACTTGAGWIQYDCSHSWKAAGGDYSATIVDETGVVGGTTADAWYIWTLRGDNADNSLDSLTWGDTIDFIVINPDSVAVAGNNLDWWASEQYTGTTYDPYLEITYSSNAAPDLPTPTLVSNDSTNTTSGDLNCSYILSDDNADKMNVTVRWYNNSILDSTINYNNSYANATFFSATLYKGNLSVGDVWNCSLRLFDGTDYSGWGNSSGLTILSSNTAPTHSNPAVTPLPNATITSNILCVNQSTSDTEGDAVTNIYNWLVDETPITLINMQFDTNESSTTADIIRDYSGLGNNGTLGNSTAGSEPIWTSEGKIGGAYVFDGVNDFIHLDKSSSLTNLTDLSIEMWINPRNITEEPHLFSNFYGGEIGHGDILLYQLDDDIGLFIENANNIETVNVLTLNTWTHIIAVVDAGNSYKIYIDGKLNKTDETDISPGPFLDNQNNFSIGSMRDGGGNFFNGTIDGVRLWNRTLSEQQIHQLYIEGLNNISYSTIKHSETTENENWTCQVTPNDATGDGLTKQNETFVTDCLNIGASTTLTSNSGDCYVFNQNDGTLDCAGYTIYGSGPTSTSLINSNHRTGITIKNCRIEDANLVIHFFDTNNSKIENTTIYNTTDISSGDVFAVAINFTNSYHNVVEDLNITEMFTESTFASGCYDGGLYGIYLKTSDNNTIKNSDFSNINGTKRIDGDGETGGCQASIRTIGDAIYSDSSDNLTIYNSTIKNSYEAIYTTASSFLNTTKNIIKNIEFIGINIQSTSTSSIIQENIINKTNIGIQISDSDEGTIKANIIESSSGQSISTSNANNLNIISNIISYGADDGIYILGSIGSGIEDNIIQHLSSTTNGGIYLDDISITSCKNNTISNISTNYALYINRESICSGLNITDTTQGIYFAGTSDNSKIYNSTISETINSTIIANSATNIIFYDVTFNKSTAQILGTATFFNYYYLRINVTDKNFDALESAVVNVTNVFGTAINKTTGADGLTPLFTLIEFNETSNGRVYFTNYNVIGNKSGYDENSTSVNLTSSLTQLLILPTSNTAPTQTAPIFFPSSPTSTQNFTCLNQSTADADSNSVTNIYNWLVDETPILLLNMPLDTNEDSTTTNLIRDYSTLNNNGTLGGGVAANVPRWTSSGKSGGAYVFDGIDDYILVNKSSSLNNTYNFTIEIWINTRTTSEGPYIFTNYDGGTVGNGDLLFYRNGQTIGSYVDGTSAYVVTGNFIATNTWYHLALVMDAGNSYKLYVNGELNQTDSSSIPSGPFFDQSNDFFIGRMESTNYWNGTIDNLRIWNKTLSASQIYQLYIDGLNNNTNSTIISDETSGNENWTCQVTPNDAFLDGLTKQNSTIIQIVNTIPNTPNPTIISADKSNLTSANLNCSYTLSDNDEDKMNVTVKWYNNSIESINIDYNNSYANSILFNAALDKGNLSGGDTWFCSLRLYDGTNYSIWGNSSNLTIIPPTIDLDLIYPLGNINSTQNEFFNVTLNVTCRNGNCGTINVSLDPDNWWNPSWEKRKEINITGVGSLTNFPVYINVTYDSEMQTDYDDLRFISGACNAGGSELAYEIENYTGTNAHVWVKIPSINAGNNQICLYYDNSGASSGENIAGVWAETYEAVWHFQNLNDSLGIHNLTKSASLDYIGGKIGRAFDWEGAASGDSLIWADADDSLDFTTEDLTIEFWIKMDNYVHGVNYIIKGLASTNNYQIFDWRATDEFSSDWGTTGNWHTHDCAGLDTEVWMHLVWVYDHTNVYFYRNGSEMAGCRDSENSNLGPVGDNNFQIGTENGPIDGIMDEVRISSSVKSTEWISQSYQVVANQATYVLFGSEENASSTKSGLISIVTGTTPFYTNTSNNPWNISLDKDEGQLLVFWVNATGTANTNHTFFAYANMTSNMSIGNITSTWNVTITGGEEVNTAPTIPYIETISAQNPVEGTFSEIEFTITVDDANGFGDINDTSIQANFSRPGETTRINSSCINISGETTTTSQNFSCTISMWYWDENGDWNISIYAEDNNQEATTNTSTSFTYNQLKSFIFSPTEINFAVAIGATNQTADNPITINNTGNYNTTAKINVEGIDLYSGSYFLGVGNFTVDTDTGGTPPAECNGFTLQNATNVTMTTVILEAGNFSLGESAQEQIYFCLTKVPSTIPSGTYNTTTTGSWAIRILLVAISFRRKKKLKNNKLLKALNILASELEKDYSKDKATIINLLIKEIKNKYRLTNKEIFETIEVRKEIRIPLNIFSTKLGALETISKYMKENLGMSYKEISERLNKNERTIWTAYNKSLEKYKLEFKIKQKVIKMPMQIFQNKKLTILEALVLYLKQKQFKYVEIAKLLNRNQRNIWTIYSKAKEKSK